MTGTIIESGSPALQTGKRNEETLPIKIKTAETVLGVVILTEG